MQSERRGARIKQWIRRIEWDLVVLFVLFGAFAYLSYEYEGETGQMPRLFLLTGALLVAVKFLLEHGEGPWIVRARALDASIVSGMGESADGAESDPRGSQTAGLIGLGALLGGFALISYVVSFLVAIPVFALGLGALLGTENYGRILIAAVAAMGLVYGIFGIIMNVPIMESALF